MSFLTGDHSSIFLYSEPLCPQSHRIKMVLSEKDVGYKSILIENPKELPQDFTIINPTGHLPFFSDRDLALTRPLIVCEYLDERFPHPPLMPIEPMMRARLKIALAHIEENWFKALKKTASPNKKTVANSVKFLQEEIDFYGDIFKQKPFFMSDEITLIDCTLVPILWRLPSIGIHVRHTAVLKYQKRMFLRPSFRQSLTEEELDLNPEAF